MPSSHPTVKTMSPTIADPLPIISAQTVSATSTSATVTLTFLKKAEYSGAAYCIADADGLSDAEIFAQVKVTPFKGAYQLYAFSAEVVIAGLVPVTQYSVYCYLVNMKFDGSTQEDVLNTMQVVESACCKSIAFTNAPAFVYADFTKYPAGANPTSWEFTFALSSAGKNSLTVSYALSTAAGAPVDAGTLSATPASASATGTVGTMSWDANYIYICTATNTWKRVAIATW